MDHAQRITTDVMEKMIAALMNSTAGIFVRYLNIELGSWR